jgi:hypothetical protein
MPLVARIARLYEHTNLPGTLVDHASYDPRRLSKIEHFPKLFVNTKAAYAHSNPATAIFKTGHLLK